MNCEIVNALNIRGLLSVLMNFAHLVRAIPFLAKLIYIFSEVLSIVVMPINFSLELTSITELLILLDFTLKGDKNK